MSERGVDHVTQLLLAWREGDEAALARLTPLVHAELQRIARRCMRGQPPGHSLQATALVNEAYVRLVDVQAMNWQNRAHFLAMAARLMRRILVDSARARGAHKRGGDAVKVSFSEDLAVIDTPSDTTLEALALLRALQGRHAEAQALVPRILSVTKRNRGYHHQTYSIARVYALGGKAEDAARWLKETIEFGFPCYPMMESDTFLDPVRNAPEIQALLVRLRSQYEGFRAMVAAPLRIP